MHGVAGDRGGRHALSRAGRRHLRRVLVRRVLLLGRRVHRPQSGAEWCSGSAAAVQRQCGGSAAAVWRRVCGGGCVAAAAVAAHQVALRYDVHGLLWSVVDHVVRAWRLEPLGEGAEADPQRRAQHVTLHAAQLAREGVCAGGVPWLAGRRHSTWGGGRTQGSAKSRLAAGAPLAVFSSGMVSRLTASEML